MKNYFISIALVLIALVQLNAQDSDPDPMIFDSYKAISGTVRTNSELLPNDFKADEFILGFQWLGDIKLIDALHMNMNQHQNQWGYFDDNRYDISQTTRKHYAVMGGGGNFPLRALSFHYEPTLRINNPGNFEVRNDVVGGDPQNSIFGFQYQRGEAIENTGTNSNRLSLLTTGNNYIIDYSNLGTANPETDPVLAKPWYNTWFFRSENSVFNDGNQNHHNGKYMRVTINLRRINDDTDGDEPVLTIKIPYKLGSNSTIDGYIRFSEIPNPIQGNLAHSNQSKFVVFPDAQDTSKVRYHITYHRPDTNLPRKDVMSVYYRRSFPMDKKYVFFSSSLS